MFTCPVAQARSPSARPGGGGALAPGKVCQDTFRAGRDLAARDGPLGVDAALGQAIGQAGGVVGGPPSSSAANASSYAAS